MFRAMMIAPLCGALVLTGCEGTTNVEWPPLPADVTPLSHQVIQELHTPASAIMEPRRVVIRDSQAFLAFWDEFHGNVVPKPTPPSVDFTQQMVLAAAMGQRPSGGYTISIAEVHANNGLVVARVMERSPGSDCIVTMAITAPATAVLIPRMDGEVQFQEAKEVVNCG